MSDELVKRLARELWGVLHWHEPVEMFDTLPATHECYVAARVAIRVLGALP